jgi:hypothetical protein
MGFQELLRGAAAGLAALGLAGHDESGRCAVRDRHPVPGSDAGPVALALATVALRATPKMIAALGRHADRAKALELLAEGFDMLEEDLDKERFFAFARRTFWESAENSPNRALMQLMIGKLDF